MAVQVERHGHGRVTEPLLYDLRMDAGSERESRVGVSKIMESDGRQPEPAEEDGKILVHCFAGCETQWRGGLAYDGDVPAGRAEWATRAVLHSAGPALFLREPRPRRVYPPAARRAVSDVVG